MSATTKFDPEIVVNDSNALDFGDYHTGLAGLLRQRYGTKPFDLKTLKAARTALKKIKSKELSASVYSDPEGACCTLGAFAVAKGVERPEDEWWLGGDVCRKYLIEAKKYDPRTVDALEAVNQFGSSGWDTKKDTTVDIESRSERYKRVLSWIEKQIEKAAK